MVIVTEVFVFTDLSYTQTFDNWSAVHKFGNTTSMYFQRILYFIQVQTTVTPPDTYAHLFAKDILAKVQGCNIERIDANAIVNVILGLRVYHNGVKDLLDFRTQCLDGLSIRTRQALSLAQIAQLYVSIFQHDSIWEYCWKSVVPVMNHTILSSRERFLRHRNGLMLGLLLPILSIATYSREQIQLERYLLQWILL